MYEKLKDILHIKHIISTKVKYYDFFSTNAPLKEYCISYHFELRRFILELIRKDENLSKEYQHNNHHFYNRANGRSDAEESADALRKTRQEPV